MSLTISHQFLVPVSDPLRIGKDQRQLIPLVN